MGPVNWDWRVRRDRLAPDSDCPFATPRTSVLWNTRSRETHSAPHLVFLLQGVNPLLHPNQLYFIFKKI